MLDLVGALVDRFGIADAVQFLLHRAQQAHLVGQEHLGVRAQHLLRQRRPRAEEEGQEVGGEAEAQAARERAAAKEAKQEAKAQAEQMLADAKAALEAQIAALGLTPEQAKALFRSARKQKDAVAEQATTEAAE